MDSEVWAALVGALVGAAISFLLLFVNARQDAKRRVEQAKLELVRELMRYRLDNDRLVLALNEVLFVFGDDSRAIELCRALRDESDAQQRTGRMSDLFNHLAKAVGVAASLSPSDIERAFRNGY